MPAAISSNMMSTLIALTNVNDQVASTQKRLNTGLKIAEASDNIAVFFRAQNFREKSEALDTTNQGISQAIANLDNVDKALETMQNNLKGAMDIMKNARAKPMPTAAAVETVGGAEYAGTTGTDLVGGSADIDNASKFQVGDTFAVTVTKNGVSTTRFFRAYDSGATSKTQIGGADLVDSKAWGYDSAGNITYKKADNSATNAAGAAAADGRTDATAFNFSTLADLQAKIQSAFGSITGDFLTTSSGSKVKGTMKLQADLSITFSQTTDKANSAGNSGAAFDFTSIYGKQKDTKGNATINGTGGTQSLSVFGQSANTPSSVNASGVTYSPVGPAQSDVDVVQQVRKDAADFLDQTVGGLANLARDAYLPGFGNVLAGDTLSVNLNDDGTVKQNIKLSRQSDPTSLGFVGWNGTTTSSSRNGFRADADLDSSLKQAESALAYLKQQQSVIAASKTMMKNRLDYNKTMVDSLKQTANAMVAADTTEEAANLAALKNQQTFAGNNLTITKSAEESLIQLLR